MSSTLLASKPAEHVSLRPMLVLTFTTGVVDAVGYLSLDRVFTGNMTGNVVVLGMGLAGSDHLPVLGPVLALCGFLLGAASAGRALRGHIKGASPITTAIFGAVALALAAVAIALAIDSDPTRAVALPVTAVLGVAMGAQAGSARHIGVPDVSTVVVTSTITGLAADSWFGSGAGAHAHRRGTAVVLILAGAAVGALLLKWHAWAAAAAAALLVTIVTVSQWPKRVTAPSR